MNMIYLEEQLQFLHFLQGGRGPWINLFLYFLNFFDTAYFGFGLISFIWIGCSWRWGIRLGFLIIVSGIVNFILKEAFGLPRPFVFDPSLAMVKLGHFGFPSGAAQGSLLFGCLLGYYWKSPWAWPIGMAYAFIISVSRLFLGVHFPLDLLGGWIAGLLLFWAFVKGVRPIEQFAIKRPTLLLSIALIGGCILWVSLPKRAAYLPLSLIVTSIGVALSLRYKLYLPAPKCILHRIYLGLFAVISSGVVSAWVFLLPLSSRYLFLVLETVIGFWISLIISPLCKRFIPIIRNNLHFG